MAGNTAATPRPTLADIDEELLKAIFAEESKYFQQACAIVNGAGGPLVPDQEEGNSLVKIAASLLKHGHEVKEIHRFFKKLIPQRYQLKLACQMEPGSFRAVPNNYRTPYIGSQAPVVTNKESGNQLHPQVLEIYECALLAAQYPVLASSHDSLDIASQSAAKKPDNPSDLELSISPASRECMYYDKDPIATASVFEIEAEDLTELVRQAFSLTHRRHDYYLKQVEKIVMNDPAKVLVREMRELQLIIDSECHPYFNPNLFRRREDYKKWLVMERRALEDIIRDQEKYIKGDIPSYPSDIPLVNKDKHAWYKRLLVQLFRVESVHCRINVGTKEAIPKGPLSAASLRLLDEFGERYRIGFLYRRASLFEYLARNFECKEWYCKYVISVLESILNFVRRSGVIVTRDEISIVKNALSHLRGHVEHSLTRVNRVFQKNLPDGGLREVIRVLSWLVVVDQDDLFGENSGMTVEQHLRKYAKEEMLTNYERQKIINADHLKLRTFGQQSTPQMISLMILDISEKLRNYRLYFKQEFIRYFDIVEMAVEVFYGLLMEDVLELCDTHPVNQQHKNIDYLMIALAYRLTLFDHDAAWEHYLSPDGQYWRAAFLKHSLVWMSSLHGKLHHLICAALQRDSWQDLHTGHSLESVESLVQSEQRTRPREILSPLSGSPGILGHTTPVAFTRSHNSAFNQVRSRSASAVEKEFSSNVTSDINKQSPKTCDDVTDVKASNSNVEATKEPSGTTLDKTPPHKSSSTNLLKNVQNTKLLSSSIASHSTESVYTDAVSHASDDYASCDEPILVTSLQDSTTVPISSSLIDTLSGINRLINVVRHFAQVLCPDRSTTRYDSLRMSPDGRNEMQDKLEQGRVNMARKLRDMVQSLTLFYGYYVIGCESCGMSDEVLEPIIGQRCLTRSLSLIQENGVRPCRHRTDGLERCNAADSQGHTTLSCAAMSRIDQNTVQSERVVEEMCVRLNNVRMIKKLLSTLVEAAVGNVLSPGSGIDHAVMGVRDFSSPGASQASTSRENDDEPSTSASSALLNDVIDKNAIERTVEELQEIEDGLVKLMAYRANDVIEKLLQLLLTLNLRSFNSRKRLQPVLNTARKTVHTLAVNLYPDCYAAVLRHLWLAIVKDFAEQKENLIFLNGTAKEQANLLLEAISYFIEIFRAEEDSIPLAFVSTTIEPVLQSLNYYTLPTRVLTQMYEALQQRNTNTVRISDNLGSRHRYQRRPSNLFIGRLRIELHSEHEYFSGQRFVECVSDRIRDEGNLGLGICAVPNGCDADSGKELGQYLLDNDILCCVGKIDENYASHGSDDDDDVDKELPRSYTGPGSALFIPERKTRRAMFNDVPIEGSQDTPSVSSMEAAESTVVIQEEGTKPTRFVNSRNVLYQFKTLDLEESVESYHPEYNEGQADDVSQNDILTVLFTRRNIEENAREFLANMEASAFLQGLEDKLRRSSISNCCWARAPLLAGN